MQTLTQRELNRALLARQGLLDPVALPLPAALERIAGIQAQYAPSMYIGLWSRVAGFERDALTRALEQRAVVQATLMRVTIHLVSPADYWPFALATREARRAAWLRTRREFDAAAMEEAAERVATALADAGTLSRKQLEELVGKPRAPGVGLWVELVRAPPAGTWERRRADLFARAEDWVGAPPDLSAEAAAVQLVARYLAGFGPASRKDVAGFTGLGLTAVDRALAELELRRFATADGEPLVDVPDGLLPGADAPAPPRLLPTWDATLLVHARRTGVLPEEHRPRLFSTRTPASFPSFTIDGAVAGTWRWEDGAVALEPFAPLARADRAALEAEASRIAPLFA